MHVNCSGPVEQTALLTDKTMLLKAMNWYNERAGLHGQLRAVPISRLFRSAQNTREKAVSFRAGSLAMNLPSEATLLGCTPQPIYRHHHHKSALQTEVQGTCTT